MASRSLASCVFFFFSSRRRHTRCSRDWSSDVCSSDLLRGADTANAKSVTAILLLATRPNDAIRVSASGPDAAAAVSALAALLAAGSGESEATAEAASGPARGAPVTAAPAPAVGPTRSTDPRKLLGVSASPRLVLGKVAQL